MSLGTCPDCGGPVSSLASACPKCGRPTDAARLALAEAGATNRQRAADERRDARLKEATTRFDKVVDNTSDRYVQDLAIHELVVETDRIHADYAAEKRQILDQFRRESGR
jgi:hypothetical protein